jgi:chromosome partitioning protein
MGRENVLSRALGYVAAGYDLAIIDTPPSLGLLTLNALTAAHWVLVPTQPQAVDLYGLRLFLDTLGQIKQELNPGLQIMGVLITFLDNRLIHHQQAIAAMQKAGLPLMDTRIGRTVRIAEASAAGETVVTYEPGNPQAQAYNKLAEELNEWLEKNNRT